MNVSLTPELDSFVAGKVESGRYNGRARPCAERADCRFQS
jgi:hypothetical protein